MTAATARAGYARSKYLMSRNAVADHLPLPPPLPAAAAQLLGQAHGALEEARAASDPLRRYAAAHLGALRGAAAVLAARTRPSSGRRRPRSAWVLLEQVAPELGEWAAFFAAGAPKRAAAEAGLSRAVTGREADDLVRDVGTFLEVVEQVVSSAASWASASTSASAADRPTRPAPVRPAARPRVVGGTDTGQ
jgi:hypothetical protein